jgi:uncharacterized Fe-S center protein
MSAKVYFIPFKDNVSVEEQVLAMAEIFDLSGAADVVSKNDFVAIKTHIGEERNTTHIKPPLIRKLVEKVNKLGGQPFLTETSTLYKGERENAVKHIMLAHLHGFGIENVGAPFIMADGLTGNSEYEVVINGEFNKTVKIAREIIAADALLVVSHPTGHMLTGIGACIKNLGMGFASRAGKMRQHSSIKPQIKTNCKFCQKCQKWCPVNAVLEKDGKLSIDPKKCIGCGECLAVCKFNAIKYDFGQNAEVVQRNMAEYALGAVKDKKEKVFYFNVLVDMTKDCDCMSGPQPKLIGDVGILASNDPVAIDMATLDITTKAANANGKTLAENSYSYHDATIQLKHAAKLGMGSLKYKLVEVKTDKPKTRSKTKKTCDT